MISKAKGKFYRAEISSIPFHKPYHICPQINHPIHTLFSIFSVKTGKWICRKLDGKDFLTTGMGGAVDGGDHSCLVLSAMHSLFYSFFHSLTHSLSLSLTHSLSARLAELLGQVGDLRLAWEEIHRIENIPEHQRTAEQKGE